MPGSEERGGGFCCQRATLRSEPSIALSSATRVYPPPRRKRIIRPQWTKRKKNLGDFTGGHFLPGPLFMPCVDVSDWHNGPRPGGALTCSDYQARGYCRHGQISRGSEWASGAAFHFPERGCCACGRSRHRLGHGALQNRSTGRNSSGMVGSSGSGSSGVLSLSGGSNQGRRESASSSGQCQCPGVSVCSNYSLAAFMLRMPKVISEPSSPWYDYLCTVYRTRALPLPLSLSILEAFYPALLPVPACTKTAHLSLRTERRWHRRWRRANISLDVDQKRACHKADCVAWLPAPPPTDAAARAFAVGRSYVRVPPQNGSAKSAFGHIVILQRPIQERRPQGREFGPQHSFPFSAVPRAVDSSSDAAWIEVSRTAFPGEGYRDYGCWFHPAVGTGVFLRRDR